MAAIGDDPSFDGAEVQDVAMVVAIRLPKDHPKAEDYIDTDFYRVASSNTATHAKIGLFRMGQLVAEDGEAVDDPEPPD